MSSRRVAPHEVLIGVRAAAICGSDLHIFKGRHPSAPLPVSIGHELAGEVLEIGSQVTHLHPGDRVTVEPVITCGGCYYCQRGEYHHCVEISFHYRRGQGAFAPYFIAPGAHVFPLPGGLTYEQGALIEPLAVALHAVKKSGLQLGHSCAVFGAGAIGLLVTALARQASAAQVLVADIQPFRLEKALQLGATHTIDSRVSDPLQVIQSLTGGLGVDRSYEAVGLSATLTQSLQALKKGGVATLLGIFEDPSVCLPANLFIQREISLSGSQGYHWDFQDALSLLEHGCPDLDALITHRLPLKDLQKGFELLRSPEERAIKVIVFPDWADR